MSTAKKAVRAQFREAVFSRDRYCCRVCGFPGRDRQGGEAHRRFHTTLSSAQLVELDAHHIYPRELMPNGGYVSENGISVCEDCHRRAEEHWTGDTADAAYSPEALYRLIGSSLQVAIEVATYPEKAN